MSSIGIFQNAHIKTSWTFRLAQSVKLMIALSIFLTYTLQFYVPMEIIWKNIKGNFNEHLNAIEYSVRIGLVVSVS